ncbi:acyl-CoA thioesterase [Nesterenkonia sp. E16_7]|uniref:acyl-CoA thioesterase n=1 Tax=unclassified Nesterenkonia TaxID=2629769 RepID=UPI001A935699|nr:MULTISPECIES: thioesterase family protein [unclassified Nesterenkonia]MBO0595578.1 acyl-CoA thioesterase [Nesterenkonia sp. E16_10]MBO0598255.1 acyl-CoA thioesterase [Nesterenkonia sp. E16_7]
MSAVHLVVLPVRWSDQDLNGHVNNARVVTLIEEARISAITSWLGDDGIPDPARPRVVVSLTVDYLRPLDHGPELTARVWVSAIGRSSYTVDYEVVQHSEVAVRARTVLVQTNPATGRSAPLPERLRRMLAQILTPQSKPVPPGAEPGASTEHQ